MSSLFIHIITLVNANPKKRKKEKTKKTAWRWEGAAWRNETRAWRNETRAWRRAMLKTPRPNTAYRNRAIFVAVPRLIPEWAFYFFPDHAGGGPLDGGLTGGPACTGRPG